MATKKQYSDEDLKRFKDLSGLSVRQMNVGLWISENKALLTRLLTIFLILISAFFYVYSTYLYIFYFMGKPMDNLSQAQVVSPRDIVKPLELSSVQSFSMVEDYDLVVKVKNVNNNFSATFDYCFYQSGKEIKCGTDFILPEQEYFLLALGNNLSAETNFDFRVVDISWKRVNRRLIPDWASYVSERSNFIISEINFLSANKSGLSENLKYNSLEFELKNDSPYSYYVADFNVLLYSANRLVGVHRYRAENLLAGEVREVKLSWPGDLINASQVKITPHVNILDELNYLPYERVVK